MAKNIKYTLITLLAVALSWILHEFAHWAAGEILGYKKLMTLNKCYPANGMLVTQLQTIIISAAGPLVTLFEAYVFYFLMRRNKNLLLLPFLLTCFYMRVLAGIMSFIKLNDEASVGNALGIGSWILPVAVIAVLSCLVVDASRRLNLTRSLIFKLIVLIIFFSSIIILTDKFFYLRLIN